MRDESCVELVVCFKPKMAAPITDAGRTDSNAADVVRCLNSLTSLDMRSIASDDGLTSLVADYFVTRQIGNTDDDSESDSSDDVDIDPPVVNIVGGEVNSDSDSSASDGADRSVVFLADEVMPRDRGKGSDSDNSDVEIVFKFRCKLNDGQPCHTRYELDELAMIRLQYLPMTHDQLDIAILDKLSCGMHLSSMTRRTRKGEQQERKVQRTDFYLHGFRICRDIIRQLHAISQDKLTALIAHYKVAGCEARIHGNKRRLPANALKVDDTRVLSSTSF